MTDSSESGSACVTGVAESRSAEVTGGGERHVNDFGAAGVSRA